MLANYAVICVNSFNILLAVTLVLMTSSKVISMEFSLPDNYDKNSPPIESNGPVYISVKIRVDRMLNVDMENKLYSVDLWVFMEWYEYRLEIKKTVEGQSAVQLDPKEQDILWKPGFLVWNMREMSVRKGLYNLVRVTIKDDKTIIYVIGVTVRTSCQFNFDMFPFDQQCCDMKFIPYPESNTRVALKWAKGNNTVWFGEYHNTKEMTTARYIMQIHKLDKPIIISSVSINFSALEVDLKMRRQILRHILEVYLPSGIFVIMSWGSFIINPEIVPGRIVLLVTNLLTLITMFESSRSHIPPSLNVQAIDIWLLCSIIFVFCALLEYALLLFIIRSGQKTETYEQGKITYNTTVYSLTGSPKQSHQMEKVKFWCVVVKTWIRQIFPHCKTCILTNNTNSKWNLLDKRSLVIFPLSFLIYNVTYWCYYIKIFKDNDLNCSKG